MMAPFRNGTMNIFSVATKIVFVSLSQVIIINNDQSRKGGLEIPRVSSSDEPNTIGYHRNTSIYSDEGWSNDSQPDHTKKISLVTPEKIRLVTPEEEFFCHT